MKYTSNMSFEEVMHYYEIGELDISREDMAKAGYAGMERAYKRGFLRGQQVGWDECNEEIGRKYAYTS